MNESLWNLLNGGVYGSSSINLPNTTAVNSYVNGSLGYNPNTTGVTAPSTTTNGGLWNTLSSPGFWQGAGNLLGGIGSIGNIVLGQRSLGLLEDQLGLQQEQWNEARTELNRMRNTRNRLNTEYMA